MPFLKEATRLRNLLADVQRAVWIIEGPRLHSEKLGARDPDQRVSIPALATVSYGLDISAMIPRSHGTVQLHWVDDASNDWWRAISNQSLLD